MAEPAHTDTDPTGAAATVQASADRPPLDRRTWLDAAIRVMAARGIDAVRVEPLARRLGVTKGSFYWHFKDRPALQSAILEFWEDSRTDATIAIVDATDGGSEEKLRRLFEETVSDSRGLQLELAVRDWARTDQRARIAVRAVDARRSVYVENFLRELGFDEADAKVRAALYYSLIMGEAMLVRDEKEAERRTRIERCLDLLMNTQTEPELPLSQPA